MSFLQMSLAGAVMILVITVLRALAMNRVPKRTFPVLWGCVLVRLLVGIEIDQQRSLGCSGAACSCGCSSRFRCRLA